MMICCSHTRMSRQLGMAKFNTWLDVLRCLAVKHVSDTTGGL